jgi:pimeloyl-ACP methyl ester carboxylesterase
MAATRRVTATDGVQLAVFESGEPSAPTVVAVHGYPDNHAVWDGVAELLARDFHVAAYDVRGAGASDQPTVRRAYRIAQLVDDLATVLDVVSPDDPVHMVAHDWGSIQAWPAVADERFAKRIATFTSISGPSLDHARAWLLDARHHPRAVLRQLAHSSYLALFQLPWLPEAAARRGVLDRGVQRASQGVPPPRTEVDKVNGLSLYRANLLGRRAETRAVPTSIPVQVIVPEDDAFVTPELAIGAPSPWVADLTVRRVAGGHWVVSEHPDLVARLIREFIAASN